MEISLQSKVNFKKVFQKRQEMIFKEKLHIEDFVSKERSEELFRKYAGVLSEVMFAEKILDVSAVGVKNMRVVGGNSICTMVKKRKYY